VRRAQALNLLVLANAISVVGNVMASVAVPWFVLTTTGSAALTGVAAFALTGPIVVGSLIAGRIVDRLGARRTSVAADLTSGATIALLPVLFAGGVLQFWHIVALLVAGTVFDAAGAAARMSLVPGAAEAGGLDLERANARYGGTEHIGYLLGAPLAGVLIAAVGPVNVLWVDAASFVLSAAAVWFLRAVPAASPRRSPVRGSLRAAMGTIRRDRALRTLVFVPAAGALLIDPLAPVILPVYAREVADSSVWLGVAVAAYGVGGLVGLAASGPVRKGASRRAVYVAVFAAWPLLYALLVPLPPIVPATVLVFGVGLLAGLIAPIETTVVQERTPPELLPRVVGSTTAIFRIAGPITILLTGLALQRVGLTPTLFALTVGTVVLAMVVALDRGVREFDQPA
jgi:predicted MFS family arabinose efflux permease